MTRRPFAPRLHATLRSAVAALIMAAALPLATAQRAIEVGACPWSEVGLELGELRLPDVRDLAPRDLADFRGKPLLLVEFAAW